ncbi:MAG: MaoC family dehydratase N-terminal domain-containing protein, partial [Rhodoferax sp.]|nr:MaoC family dehydratase N-terminal domain-containing protein [Pseudorhodobacter sp.]
FVHDVLGAGVEGRQHDVVLLDRAGHVDDALALELPGHGAVYLGQSLKFMAPVRPGDTVYAEVKVTAIDHAKRRVTLETHCAVGDTVVLKGEALVLAPSRKFD